MRVSASLIGQKDTRQMLHMIGVTGKIKSQNFENVEIQMLLENYKYPKLAAKQTLRVTTSPQTVKIHGSNDGRDKNDRTDMGGDVAGWQKEKSSIHIPFAFMLLPTTFASACNMPLIFRRF